MKSASWYFWSIHQGQYLAFIYVHLLDWHLTEQKAPGYSFVTIIWMFFMQAMCGQLPSIAIPSRIYAIVWACDAAGALTALAVCSILWSICALVPLCKVLSCLPTLEDTTANSYFRIFFRSICLVCATQMTHWIRSGPYYLVLSLCNHNCFLYFQNQFLCQWFSLSISILNQYLPCHTSNNIFKCPFSSCFISNRLEMMLPRILKRDWILDLSLPCWYLLFPCPGATLSLISSFSLILCHKWQLFYGLLSTTCYLFKLSLWLL